MSYVGTCGENTRTFGTPANNARDVSFAQLSRGIIPKPYLKGKSMSAFWRLDTPRHRQLNCSRAREHGR